MSIFIQGAAAAANVNYIKATGNDQNHQWGSTIMETAGTNLLKIFNAYKDYALSMEFVRSIVFQLVYTLGVGRHAHGLHHNDLLTLSNIRFIQVIKL